MKTRLQPPKESKAELMAEVGERLDRRFPDHRDAILHLLNFFTTVDLVGIRDELLGKDNRDGIQPRRN